MKNKMGIKLEIEVDFERKIEWRWNEVGCSFSISYVTSSLQAKDTLT